MGTETGNGSAGTLVRKTKTETADSNVWGRNDWNGNDGG